MPNPRLASRYAKALLDLAIEQGKTEEVYQDMLWLNDVNKQSKDFSNLLRSPIIKPSLKLKALHAVLSGHTSDLTTRFINLLVTKNREENLPEIATEFGVLYKEHKDIHPVKLTTPVPVSNDVKENIINKVKQLTGYQNIELEEKINPDLIGGFVLEVGDKMIDKSIAYDLKQISKQFNSNDFAFNVR